MVSVECSETSKNINKHKLNKYDKLNNSDPASSADASHKNGKRDLNFIQINTCKGKQATNDLVIFAKNYTSLIMLVQEPYVNGKNIIPKPLGDIGVIVDTTVDLDTRPRACIDHHRSLTNKLWRMDTQSSRDCTTIQTNIDNVSTLIFSCYMDRLEKDCPPDAFKKVVNFAKKHNMALISGTDANANNTYWNSRITDKAGTDRGNSLLSYIAKETFC